MVSQAIVNFLIPASDLRCMEFSHAPVALSKGIHKATHIHQGQAGAAELPSLQVTNKDACFEHDAGDQRSMLSSEPGVIARTDNVCWADVSHLGVAAT